MDRSRYPISIYLLLVPTLPGFKIGRTRSAVRGFDLQGKQHGGHLGVVHFWFENYCAKPFGLNLQHPMETQLFYIGNQWITAGICMRSALRKSPVNNPVTVLR